MIGRLLRHVAVEMHDPSRRTKLAHPVVAQLAGDGLDVARADEDGKLVAIGPGEVAEHHMAIVRRHEFAEQESAGHAGAPCTGDGSSSRAHARNPKIEITRNNA